MDLPTATAIGRLVPRALEAARKALRDADTKEIPPHLTARLRRVRAASGDLPPPLLRPLVEALDADPWLRERALAAWPDAAQEAPGTPHHAAALYLLRPDGWESAFAVAAIARATQETQARAERSEQEAREAVDEARVARQRERDAARRADQAEAQRRAMDRSERQPVRAQRAEARRAEAALAEEREAWAQERQRLEGEIAALDALVGQLREEVRSLRAARADAERAVRLAAGGSSWSDRDAVGLAEYLDDVASQARRPTKAAPNPPGGEPPRFSLPAGVRPDEAAAIDAVLRWGSPLWLIIDGYNVGLQLADEPAEARERLRAIATRLMTAGGLLVSLVWDSRDGDHQVARQRGLEVRFAGVGTTADDEIVTMLGSAAHPAVVVTSDRELRERAIGRRATVVHSEALIAWVRQRA